MQGEAKLVFKQKSENTVGDPETLKVVFKSVEELIAIINVFGKLNQQCEEQT